MGTTHRASNREAHRKNLALFKEEASRRCIVMRSKPVHLTVVLTTRCNLRCGMCARVERKGELPRDIAEKIRPLYPHLCQLHWQGGEVFLDERFDGMFEEAARYPDIAQFIVTSGLLIDRHRAERLVRGRAGLTFSIDTVDPASYERIRRGARFKRLLEALRFLEEAERRTRLRGYKGLHVVVMEENLRQLPPLVPFAVEHGFSSIDFTPCLPLDDARGVFHPGNLPAFRRELQGLQEDLRRIGENARRARVRLTDRVSPILGRLFGRDPAPLASSRSLSWDCRMPWRGLTVNAEYRDGDITPDCMCYQAPVGNIAEDDLIGAWNNDRMQEYRRRVLNRDVEGLCNSLCVSGEVNPVEWFGPLRGRLAG